MQDDARLLERYARERAEEAFAELVRRHINLVYTAALRQTGGHAPIAEDVTQQVFAELARQAGRLTRHPALSGWLYTTTRNLALRVARSEVRRQHREQEAEMIRETANVAEPAPDWNRLAPVLDEAMHELSEKDRQAILLRYFEDADFRAVGAALGLSDGAARMRVERALDKLRDGLVRRGIVSTTSTLAAALATQSVLTAPATLAAAIATGALTTVAVATPITWGVLQFMAMTKAKTLIIAGVTAALASGVYVQTKSLNRARAEVAELRAELAGRVGRANVAPATNFPSSVAASPLSPVERRELLRLRGEMARLRQPPHASIAVLTNSSARNDFPVKSEQLSEKWLLGELVPQGNSTPFAALKTALAAIVQNDFETLYAARLPDSRMFTDREKSRQIFESLKEKYQDVTGFNPTQMVTYQNGQVHIEGTIERSRDRVRGEPTFASVRLRPHNGEWGIDKFNVVFIASD